MRLNTLQIFPKGNAGWKSDLLRFGNEVTQLFGPNGCGKTPLVQSIAFCLGYPCTFRDAIYNQCSHASLSITVEGKTYLFSRMYTRDVEIKVTNEEGISQNFYSEKNISIYLFELLKLQTGNLVTKSNQVGQAYISAILPFFYLDQDNGYSEFYSPPSNFIKDQFSEMTRMIFDLPIKNSFDEKKDRIKVKEELDYFDKLVSQRLNELNLAKQSFPNSDESGVVLNNEIQALENEFENLKISGTQHDESVNVLDRIIWSNRNSIREIDEAIAEISKRSNSIAKIVDEINIEIRTLSLNEESKRVFYSFNEICGASNCQLFSSSTESYGKNLLYLKDQIKDLERNVYNDTLRKTNLEENKLALERQTSEIMDNRKQVLNKSEVSALVETISTLKNRIFTLQLKRSDSEKITVLEKRYFEALANRSKTLDRYEEFSTDRQSNPNIIELKIKLRNNFIRWLDILNTDNISRDISFKDDFIPILGTETVSQIKGSTKVRTILAFHAALIELISQQPNKVFKFLILDTPKQHEIHDADLDRYIKALKELSSFVGVQIIFSTTEYHYMGNSQDSEWSPQYPGEKHNMFFQ